MTGPAVSFVELAGASVTTRYANGSYAALELLSSDEARAYAARLAAHHGVYVLDRAPQEFLAW